LKKVKAVIHFEDEAPRIGSGVRRVHIQTGRVWAYVTEISSGARVRFPITRLAALRPRLLE